MTVLSCPFCDSNKCKQISIYQDSTQQHYVICTECQGRTGNYEHEYLASNAWSRFNDLKMEVDRMKFFCVQCKKRLTFDEFQSLSSSGINQTKFYCDSCEYKNQEG